MLSSRLDSTRLDTSMQMVDDELIDIAVHRLLLASIPEAFS